MRAAVYHEPGSLSIEERARPDIGPGDALLRVSACGICGTDQRIVSGGHRYFPPGIDRVPGHELVGEIVAAGKDVAGALPTGLVFVAPNMGCGTCPQCRSGNNNLCAQFQAIGITMDGGFAEYVRIPAAAIAQGNVIPLGSAIDAETATLIEPLACVIRGQAPLAIAAGENVLVVGGGPIGILHVMLARARGAGRIILADHWLERLAIAKRMGADVAVNAREEDVDAVVARETGGQGADVVIIAAPSAPAMAAALGQAAVRGRIAWFAGLPKGQSTLAIDANVVHYRELRITGTTACSTDDCRQAADLVREGRLDLAPLVSRRVGLPDLASAFAGSDKARIKTVMVN